MHTSRQTGCEHVTARSIYVLLSVSTVVILKSSCATVDGPESRPWVAQASRLQTDWETQWTASQFIDPGEVRTENGMIYLEKGNNLTGITWPNPPCRIDYQIALEAMRVSGDDFFCGLTFPVDEHVCTLIVGGWHGNTVGLSCVDYDDASNNETTQYMQFDPKRWYTIRLRVTRQNISAWINELKVVDLDTQGRAITIRDEMEPSRPLGIATWRTTAAIRNFQFRPLSSLSQ